MAKAIRRCGEVWLSMAKELYVEPKRKMKGLNEQGKTDTIELLKPALGENGEMVYENDLSAADFDVVPTSARRLPRNAHQRGAP
jgi:hypothetical protein